MFRTIWDRLTGTTGHSAEPTVETEIADLNEEIMQGLVEEVVRRLRRMGKKRRRVVLSTGALLLTAAENRMEGLVARLLDLGAPMDVPDGSGRTPLWLAAHNDDGRTVDALLRHACRNLVHEADVCADVLHVCVSEGHAEALSAVLCFGIGWDAALQDLSQRVKCRRVSCLEVLMQWGMGSDDFLLSALSVLPHEELEDALALCAGLGVDINRPMQADGRTPLGKAASNRCSRKVALLLAAGADPCVLDQRCCTALDYVTLEWPGKCDPLLPDLLFAGALAPPLPALLGRHPLRDVVALSWLMQGGSCFEVFSGTRFSRGKYPHLFPNCRGKVLRILWHVLGPLSFGLRDDSGLTVLHLLSFPSSHESVSEDLAYLLERGMDPNLTNDAGDHSLVMAVASSDGRPLMYERRVQIVDELLSFGASLVLPGQHHGVLKANLEQGGDMLEMLMERGADIGELDDESLCDHCRSLGPSVLRLLVEHGWDFSPRSEINTKLQPHVVSLGRHWSPFLTDTETIYMSCRSRIKVICT